MNDEVNEDCQYLVDDGNEKSVIFYWNAICSVKSSASETKENTLQLHKILKQISNQLHVTHDLSTRKNVVSSSKFVKQLFEIACAPCVPLDLRNTCGLLIIQVLSICQLSVKKQLLDKDEYLHYFFNSILHKENVFAGINILGEMACYHGLICCCSHDKLYKCCQNEKDLLFPMIQRVLCVITQAQEGPIILLSSRLLNHMILRLLELASKSVKLSDELMLNHLLKNYSVNCEITKYIIDALWLLWDHYLDSAKHLARESFGHFIKFHEVLDPIESSAYFQGIGESLIWKIPLRKHAFSALSSMLPVISVKLIIESRPNILVDLVHLLADPVYASHSITLLESLFIKLLKEVDKQTWQSLWYTIFIDNFSKQMLTYGFEAIFEKLLVAGSEDIQLVINDISATHQKSDNKLCLLLMLTKFLLKKIKLPKIEDEDLLMDNEKPLLWKKVLPFNYIESCLKSPDDVLKNLAFNLLSDSSKTTELYHKQELSSLLNYITLNISHQQASFRQKFLNNIKKILNRIDKGVFAKLKIRKNETEASPLILMFEKFIEDLFHKMIFNLHCSANHPRINTSLQICQMIISINLNSAIKPQSSFCYLKERLFTVPVCDSLLLCMWNSYELNKILALDILKSVGVECPQLWKGCTETLKTIAYDLSSSSRPQDSLTACYLFNSYFAGGIELTEDLEICPKLNFCTSMVNELRKDVQLANASIMKAASTSPMYGNILCVKTVLADTSDESFTQFSQTWYLLFDDLIQICLEISKIVSPIVKNSSPEGHLPSDFGLHCENVKTLLNKSLGPQELGFKEAPTQTTDQVVKAYAVSSQMILLFGWRNIKEISLLFGLLVQILIKRYDKLLIHESITCIGSFYMDQLFETKHRGAFEQAYAGFLMVCNSLWRCSGEKLSALPEFWLRNTLTAVRDCNDTRLCATRRSAGVPFIIQAILTTEPAIQGSALFDFTLTSLLEMAANDSNMESKLHAFNILRALFKETHLGDSVVPYVSEGVRLALEGYKDGSWNIRNAASLLFAALVTRMLGVKRSHEDLHSKNSISAFVFFKRYPELYDLFLREMKVNVEEMQNNRLSPSTYPIMLILARFAPSSSEGHSSAIDVTPFIPLVLSLSSSPILQLRVLAAKALTPFVTVPTLGVTIEKVCDKFRTRSQNGIHGSLLCFLQIIVTYKEHIFNSPDLLHLIDFQLSSLKIFISEDNRCNVTKSAALRIFLDDEIFKLISASNMSDDILSISLLLIKELGDGTSHSPGAILCVQEVTKLYINLCHKSNKLQDIFNLLDHQNLSVRLVAFDYVKTLASNLIPESVVEIVLDNLNSENHIEFHMKLYEVLHQFLDFENRSFNVHEKDILKILFFILDTVKKDHREELVIQKLLLSGKIIQWIIKCGKFEERKANVIQWSEVSTCFSTCDNSSFVRTNAIKAIASVLSLVASDLTNDKSELTLLESILEALVDDDATIRSIASTGAFNYLKAHPKKIKNYPEELSTEDCLREVLGSLAGASKEAIGLLIQYAIKEEVIEEFGLAQEDDRAFEKGETKVFREDFMLAHKVAAVLEPKAESIALIESKRFLSFFISISEKCTNEVDSKVPQDETVLRFLQLLKTEIEHILGGLTCFMDQTLFSLKHFNVWISRLARRAVLWKAFHEISLKNNLQIDEHKLSILTQSSIKPSIICDIIEWLR